MFPHEEPMISHEEALRLIHERVRTLGTESLPLRECAGRVLAADATARVASPPFDKAAMDGYAVRSADVGALPVELQRIGDSLAGSRPDLRIGPGECCGIATGAPVPAGADLVVRIEDTAALPDHRVRILKVSRKNICAAGEDIALGQVVLRAGERLTPLRLGIAAASGHDRLIVYRKPSIALLCTGTEIVEAPAEPRPGQIYNSNGPMLRALLEPLGGAFDYLGIVEDTPAAMEAAVRRGLEKDLLVVTGGVSAGPLDLVPGVLEKAGVRIAFHKCAIKPGKPVLFGTFEQGGRTSCVFALPGNPLSCYVVHHVLMLPAIARMSGSEEIAPVYRRGVARKGFPYSTRRKHYCPCRVETIGGVSYLERAPSHGSADIMSACAVRAFMALPPGLEQVADGQELDYFET